MGPIILVPVLPRGDAIWDALRPPGQPAVRG